MLKYILTYFKPQPTSVFKDIDIQTDTHDTQGNSDGRSTAVAHGPHCGYVKRKSTMVTAISNKQMIEFPFFFFH